MPKVKRIRAAALAGKRRQDPLGQVIQDDINKDKYASMRGRHGRHKMKGAKTEDDELLDEKTSQRILKLSKQQQLEIEAEEEKTRRNQLQRHSTRAGGSSDEDEGDDDDDDELDSVEGDDDYIQHDEGFVTVAEGAEGLSAEDEALVASMMNPSSERRTLADFILEKIEEKGTNAHEADDQGPSNSLPPKVVEVYTDIGKLLSHYSSGKLPKAFKVIPSLSNWEEILYLTRPDLWTPQAMFAATRIFCSNLNPKMAQRFYNLVLLDAVRGDIQFNKKLNYHYYMAIKKSVYKPAAFFKGILLPLSKDNCTLREAAIVASVLQRVSIPVHHSAVAIHKLAQQRDYSGATSIFIKTLLNKKYSLPSPVIGSLVRHFASFINDRRELPVLWHQSLLVFCQRYKNEVQDESRDALKRVMKVHFHSKITPEIRRELFGLQAFKEERKTVHDIRGDNMEL
jgi:essential nuclear protein 1